MPISFSKRTLPLHQTASGCSYEIDVWEYQPGNPEKTIYVQGGLHGIELSGIPVVYEFMKEVEAQQPAWRFICVPQSNPMGLDSQVMGIQTGYNNIHTNQQNCWNWNRIGDLREQPSQEGRWINTLLELAAPADMTIDLHTAGCEAAPHVYCHSSQVEVVQGTGVPHILSWENASPSFSDTCYTLGKVAITFELSASRLTTPAIVQRSLQYLRRMLGWEEPVDTSKVWKTGTQLRKWYAPKAGVICWHHEAGATLQEGDDLATLYTRAGSETLKAPASGVFLLKNPIHAPHQHQELAKFLVESNHA